VDFTPQPIVLVLEFNFDLVVAVILPFDGFSVVINLKLLLVGSIESTF
jgi:hypothetical protein